MEPRSFNVSIHGRRDSISRRPLFYLSYFGRKARVFLSFSWVGLLDVGVLRNFRSREESLPSKVIREIDVPVSVQIRWAARRDGRVVVTEAGLESNEIGQVHVAVRIHIARPARKLGLTRIWNVVTIAVGAESREHQGPAVEHACIARLIVNDPQRPCAKSVLTDKGGQRQRNVEPSPGSHSSRSAFFASASTSRSPAWCSRRPATSSENHRTSATSESWSSVHPSRNNIRKK